MNKKKIKNSFKKSFSIFAVMLTILSLFTNIQNVKAETYKPIDLGTIAGTGANVKQGYNTAWWSAGIGKISVNGEIAFCIEPTTLGLGGSYSVDSVIPENVQEKLSKIVLYGWDMTSKTNDDYATTQYMIWEALGATVTQWYGEFGNRYAGLKQNVQNKIDRHYIKPSFNGSSNYEVNLGESLTITDSNNILSNFYVGDSGNANVSIQGNNLIVTPTMDTPDNLNITLKKVLDTHLGTSIAYRSSADDGQDVAIFKVSDPVRANINIKVNKFGSVKIAKMDEEGTYVPNTTFKLSYNEDMANIIGEYTTESDGTVQIDELKPQMVYIQETSVPENLVLNPAINSVMIIPNQVVDFSQTNKIQKGKVLAVKEDKDMGNLPQGDATLDNAVYGLFTKDDIVNPISKSVIIPAGTKVAERTTYADGSMDMIENLYLGNYYFQELNESNGYFLNDEKIDVSLKYGNVLEEVVLLNITSKETVITGDFDVEKIITSGNSSEIVQKEKDAEFIVVLKKYVDMYGSIEEAYKHRDEFTNKEYDKLITNENGYDKTNPLAYGTYVVKQIKGQVDTDILETTWEFKVEKENQKTLRYIINNRPFTSQVKLIKVDAETGKRVTLNSAKFKIKDANGNYVIQKVGGVKYDTFTTNSKNNIVSSVGKDGEVILPLQVKAGTYSIQEVESPEGFLALDYTPTFTVSNIYSFEEDEDKEPIIEIKIKNSRPYGKLTIQKTDKDTAQPLASVEYELTAKEDIINMIDGTLAYKAGQTVSTGKTNASGQIVIDKLFMGKYELKEVLTNEGYVLSEKVHEIIFEKKDDTSKQYDVLIDVTNIAPIGEIHLIKADKDTSELLSGVTYELTAKENIYSLDGRNTLLYEKGSPVSKDISENGLYTTNELGEINISDLPLGLYELKEVYALDGYVADKNVYTIDLTFDHSDKTVYTHELNLTNIAPIGELHLIKADKDTSELLSGVTYELIAKENIYSLDGRNTLLYEKGDTVSKDISENGLYVTNELGEINISDLPLGVYELKEVKALNSHVTDKTVYEIDLSYDGSDRTLYVKTLNLTNMKTIVELSKVDITNDKELEGAFMTLTDYEGNIIETWTSTKENHIMRGLEVGKEYTLIEDTAPLGYVKAESVNFTVKDSEEVQKVTMKDEIIKVEISKQDLATGEELPGAKLQIIDKNNEVIREWTSDGKPTMIERFPAGEYTLIEVSVPNGYELAESVKFTVEETAEIQKVIMKDKKKPIEIVKTGDTSAKALYIGLLIVSVVGLAILKKRNKKNKK